MSGKPSSSKNSDPTVGQKTDERSPVKNPLAVSHDGCTAQNQSGNSVNPATKTTRDSEARDTSFMKSPRAGTHEGTANSGMDTETMQHSRSIPQASPSLAACQTSQTPQSSMDITKESKFMDSSARVHSTADFMNSLAAGAYEVTAMDTQAVQHSWTRSMSRIATSTASPEASPLVIGLESEVPQSSVKQIVDLKEKSEQSKSVDPNTRMDPMAGFMKFPLPAGAHKVTASDMEHSRNITPLASPIATPQTSISVAGLTSEVPQFTVDPMMLTRMDPNTTLCPIAVILSVGDLPILTNILGNAASKFMTIGDQLGFADGELRSIRSIPQCTTGGDRSCFRELLAQWLKWAPPKHKLPTLEKLASAVREAGEERLAYDLPQMYQEKKALKNLPQSPTISTDEESLHGSQSSSATGNEMSQSHDDKKNEELSLPHLDTSGLSHEQVEALKGRLIEETTKIMLQFQNLVTALQRSLAQKVSVEALAIHLSTLGAFSSVKQHKPILDECLDKINEAPSMIKAFWILRDYFSFFNYHIIEHIITGFCTKQDELNVQLQKYKEDFCQYCKRKCTECPVQFGRISRVGQQKVTFTLDANFQLYRIEELQAFRHRLAEILQISEVTLRSCYTDSKRSIDLVFQVPTFVAEKIFPLSSEQESALIAEGVVELVCGKYRWTKEEWKMKHALLTPSGRTILAVPSIQELLRDVHPDKLDRPCQDEHLCDISLSITDWSAISPFLRLTVAEEQAIETDFISEERRRIEMLRKWRQKFGVKATYKELANVFYKLKMTDLVETVCELLNSKAGSPKPLPGVVECPPPLQEYATYLRARYSHMKMPCAISNWPQVLLQQYIYLTVIPTDQLTQAESSEFAKETIHGDIDDICKKKEPIDIGDILKPNGKYPIKVAIIKGAPGIGKSTIAWRICRKWGKNILFQEYCLLVLLQFRDERIRDANNIADLFYYPDDDVQHDIVCQIIKSNGQGLLLIFEGYDELPESRRASDSVFHRILKGADLPNATIIITTRPTAISELLSICAGETKSIEVLGFKDTEVTKYIESRFTNEKLRAEFQQYLAFHPHIHKMMYVPLNCAVVIEVYLSSKTSTAPPPQTITHLYTALIIALLQRYLGKHEVYRHEILQNFKSLQRIKPVHDQFLQVCRLAYTGVVKSEMELIFHDLPDDFHSLDLMRSASELHVDRLRSIYGICHSHNFLHSTIQEFLAAFHIAQWNAQEQIGFFQKHINSDKIQPVLSFLSGLTEAGLDLWNAVGSFAQHQQMCATCLESTYCVKLPVLQWLFESQNPDACTSVLGSANPVGFRYDGPAFPFDFFVLGYCIANSSCGWELQIRFPTGTEWIEMLLKGLACQINTSSARGLQALDISYCELSVEAIKFLCYIPANFLQNLTHLVFCNTAVNSEVVAELLNFLPNLQRFVMWRTPLSHGGTAKMVKHLTELSSLREVVFKDAGIGLEDYKALRNLMKMSKSITLLDVGDNPCSCEVPHSISPLIEGLAQSKSLVAVTFPESVLTSEDTERLALALKTKATLENLCISYCKMATGDTICLIEALNTTAFRHLHSLYMAGCNIRSEGAASLAKGILAKNCVLEVLDLSENSIRVDGASAIAEMLCKNTCLKGLYLANNQFEGKGAVCIAKALNENCKSKIEILKLSRNSIEPADEFEKFADSITKCTNLHNLYLDNCEIQAKGAMYLAKLLERNSTLQVVSLSGNPVGMQGAAAFAEALRCNKTLLELWLDDKSIGSEGAGILIRALQSNTCLQVLYLLNECKPRPLDQPQQARVTFMTPCKIKPCIPPFVPLFQSKIYSF